MANSSALSLYELIGAPLNALVDAEAQAARATAEFIQTVGFKPESDATNPEDEDHFGRLRMVTFRHTKKGDDGVERTFKIEVPLLSLIPIPALQIKDAELDYFIKILDNPRKQVPESADSTENKDNTAKESISSKTLIPKITRELKGTIGRPPTASSRQSSLDMQIKIKMRMEQADIPAGMARLFNLLEQNVASREEK